MIACHTAGFADIWERFFFSFGRTLQRKVETRIVENRIAPERRRRRKANQMEYKTGD